jgi:hypothetical protein
MWNGYVATNLPGGDPTVLKVASGNYLMIYVGQPYKTAVASPAQQPLIYYPNPARDYLTIRPTQAGQRYTIANMIGQQMATGTLKSPTTHLDISGLKVGVYLLYTEGSKTAVHFEKY